jgi:hypothetical protein
MRSRFTMFNNVLKLGKEHTHTWMTKTPLRQSPALLLLLLPIKALCAPEFPKMDF